MASSPFSASKILHSSHYFRKQFFQTVNTDFFLLVCNYFAAFTQTVAFLDVFSTQFEYVCVPPFFLFLSVCSLFHLCQSQLFFIFDHYYTFKHCQFGLNQRNPLVMLFFSCQNNLAANQQNMTPNLRWMQLQNKEECQNLIEVCLYYNLSILLIQVIKANGSASRKFLMHGIINKCVHFLNHDGAQISINLCPFPYYDNIIFMNHFDDLLENDESSHLLLFHNPTPSEAGFDFPQERPPQRQLFELDGEPQIFNEEEVARQEQPEEAEVLNRERPKRVDNTIFKTSLSQFLKVSYLQYPQSIKEQIKQNKKLQWLPQILARIYGAKKNFGVFPKFIFIVRQLELSESVSLRWASRSEKLLQKKEQLMREGHFPRQRYQKLVESVQDMSNSLQESDFWAGFELYWGKFRQMGKHSKCKRDVEEFCLEFRILVQQHKQETQKEASLSKKNPESSEKTVQREKNIKQKIRKAKPMPSK